MHRMQKKTVKLLTRKIFLNWKNSKTLNSGMSKFTIKIYIKISSSLKSWCARSLSEKLMFDWAMI